MAAEKYFLWTLLVVWEYFGIYRANIRVGGLPRGATSQGRALRACGLLGTPLAPSPSPLGVFWSKKNHRESFIPFGLRLIFLSEKVKNKEKQQFGAGPPVNRLVPKII